MLSLRIIDIVDIAIVAGLVYYIYRMARGTNVMIIFWALLIVLIASWGANAAGMRLLGALLNAITSVGLIALIVIFQPEIRKFLLFLGTKTQLDQSLWKRFRFWQHNIQQQNTIDYEAYVGACMHMSQSKTGALIVFKRRNEVEEIINTGERSDALAAGLQLQLPLYLLAARCILPVTSRLDIDPNLGLRHRSAIGVTEQLDVLSVIVSEETGAISYAIDGQIHHDISPVELRQALERYEC